MAKPVLASYFTFMEMRPLDPTIPCSECASDDPARVMVCLSLHQASGEYVAICWNGHVQRATGDDPRIAAMLQALGRGT